MVARRLGTDANRALTREFDTRSFPFTTPTND